LLPVLPNVAAATKSAAALSRVSARTLQTARSALFNPAPAGAFSLFHIYLFQKEKYGRRRQGASFCRWCGATGKKI